MASTIPTRAPGLECRREIIEQAVRLGDFVIHVHKDRCVERMSLQPRIVRFTETVSTRRRNCWPPLSSPPIQSVDVILREASDKLAAAGRDGAMDGYRKGTKARAWQIADAIWAALVSHSIAYVLPPKSFERFGQQVRGPSDILSRKVGTCLDLTLLYASCLEQAGLNPILALTEGHSFVGARLVDEDFSRAGSMRSPVIVVGRFAFKFARNARGRASNLYEAKLYRSANATRRALLCPVLWVSRNGSAQIMRAGKPLTDMMGLKHHVR